MIQTEDGYWNTKSNMVRRGQGLENLRVSLEFGTDVTAQVVSPAQTSLRSIQEQELMNRSNTVTAFDIETYFSVIKIIQANYIKSRKYRRGTSLDVLQAKAAMFGGLGPHSPEQRRLQGRVYGNSSSEKAKRQRVRGTGPSSGDSHPAGPGWGRNHRPTSIGAPRDIASAQTKPLLYITLTSFSSMEKADWPHSTLGHVFPSFFKCLLPARWLKTSMFSRSSKTSVIPGRLTRGE